MTKITVQPRDEKISAANLRRGGMIPAIVYSKGKVGIKLALPGISFAKLFEKAGESSLIDLDIAGMGTKKVLVHDMQRDALTSKITHVDFFEVDLKENVTAPVGLVLVGECPIVKDEGGTVITHLNEIEIECLPADLIQSIAVDVSVLTSFDSAIYVKDLKVPANIKIKNNGEDMVVNVAPPKAEVEEKPGEEAAAATAAVEGEQPAEAAPVASESDK